MKKFLILVLSVVMCVALAACVSPEPQTNGDEDYDETRSEYEVDKIEIGTNLGSFTSEDLDGNEVTEAVFADKDVTVVNVWATFCDPCKEEMPDLQAMAEALPDNAQIIGIVFDAPQGETEMIDEAKKICAETGVKYTNILMSDSIMEAFRSVEAVPTTFIVDKSGNTICKVIVGADVEAYKKAVEDYLKG